MFAKLVVFAAAVAAVAAQADRYPAGVNPSLCPNYPHCDNAFLATYNQPGAILPRALSAAGYPAGVSPASCPNYPYCSNVAPAAHVAPLPGFSSRQYPDGVSPAVCPNYPYCH